MSNKSRVRKHTQPAMSPLLRALTYSRTAHEPVTEAMLLQCYAALDAFQRGHGSRDLHMTLSRHLLVSQELALLGLGEDLLGDVERAHAAMVQLDAREQQGEGWVVTESEYERLCTALAILDAQLAVASLSEIASAEAKMIEGLMRSARIQAVAEATA
ncbi:hypothetical protein P3T18_006013 [Paraburkholderia sp. GAS199]|uniref:hypothetical protein n=1 Tax=Paraburkholderia sp. GAS199 TaxID=3035126 RepID=UPI003D2134B4